MNNRIKLYYVDFKSSKIETIFLLTACFIPLISEIINIFLFGQIRWFVVIA